jgi:hypothetical protein
MGKFPVTKRLALPATEIIRLLNIQRGMLTKWTKALEEPMPPSRKDEDKELRERIQQHADALGLDELASQIGCNKDTLRDFLLEKTKPHGETMKKLRAFAES